MLGSTPCLVRTFLSFYKKISLSIMFFKISKKIIILIFLKIFLEFFQKFSTQTPIHTSKFSFSLCNSREMHLKCSVLPCFTDCCLFFLSLVFSSTSFYVADFAKKKLSTQSRRKKFNLTIKIEIKRVKISSALHYDGNADCILLFECVHCVFADVSWKNVREKCIWQDFFVCFVTKFMKFSWDFFPNWIFEKSMRLNFVELLRKAFNFHENSNWWKV